MRDVSYPPWRWRIARPLRAKDVRSRERAAVVPPALKAASDQLAHDLACSAVNPADARVAPDACDRILIHIAGPAVELQRGVARLPLHLGVPILASRGFVGG